MANSRQGVHNPAQLVRKDDRHVFSQSTAQLAKHWQARHVAGGKRVQHVNDVRMITSIGDAPLHTLEKIEESRIDSRNAIVGAPRKGLQSNCGDVARQCGPFTRACGQHFLGSCCCLELLADFSRATSTALRLGHCAILHHRRLRAWPLRTPRCRGVQRYQVDGIQDLARAVLQPHLPSVLMSSMILNRAYHTIELRPNSHADNYHLQVRMKSIKLGTWLQICSAQQNIHAVVHANPPAIVSFRPLRKMTFSPLHLCPVRSICQPNSLPNLETWIAPGRLGSDWLELGLLKAGAPLPIPRLKIFWAQVLQ